MRNNPWDRIPKMEIDFSEDWPKIAKRATEAYYEVARHCSSETLRAETWKLSAISSWILSALVIYSWMFSK